MAVSYTTTYNLTKPEVGASEDAWGGLLNTNFDNIDNLLDGTTAITGIDINSGSIDGTVIGANSAAAITGTTITGTSFVTSGNMTFGDNDKAIFGAGSDLQIYHDGSHSRIVEGGTGQLKIQGTELQLYNADATKLQFQALDTGEVSIYYNNSKKLATTSTGIDVTGTVTADGLTVDGTSILDSVRINNTGGSNDAVLVVDSNSALHPAIKIGSPVVNGYTLIADDYLGDESTLNIGLGYSGGNPTFSRSVKPSTTAESEWVSSQDTFAAKPAAFEIANDGFHFYHTRTSATTTTDSAVTLTSFLDISGDGIVANNAGTADADFRVESDGNTHAFFVDAGNNNVEINTTLTMMAFTGYNSNPNKSFSMGASNYTAVDVGRFNKYETTVTGNAGGQSYDIYGEQRTGASSSAAYSLFKIDGSSGGVTINEDGLPDADFRVESDANANAIFMDATNSSTGFGTTPNGSYRVDISGAVRHSNYAYYDIGQMSASSFYYNRIIATAVGGGSRYFEYGIADTGATSNGAAWFALSQDDGGISYFWSDNSGVFRTSSSSANVGGTGGTVVGTQTSDERLKTIEDGFEYGIETVKQLQPIAYTFTNDSTQQRHLGFGAQTTQGVVPEVVYDSGQSLLGYDVDPNDSKTETARSQETKMMMDGIQLMPVLTKALQEAITKIETLEAKVTALENA